MRINFVGEVARRKAKIAERELAEVAVLNEELEAKLASAEGTIRSLAVMLGWGNVPPQDSLERSIKALRDRLASAEARAEQRCIKHAAHNPEGDCIYCDHEGEKERADAAEARQTKVLELAKTSMSPYMLARVRWILEPKPAAAPDRGA